MFALYRTVSYRYLRLRWSRAALIVISIMLGVALLVATRVLIQSMQKASNESLNPFARAADLVIMNGETGVSRDLADELQKAQIPGLAQIEPLVIADCGFIPRDKDGDLAEPGIRVKLVGISVQQQLTTRLKEMQQDRHAPIEIQLDRDSKVRIEPGVVRGANGSKKSWSDIVPEDWNARLQFLFSMVREERTLVVVGKKLASRLADDSERTSISVFGHEQRLYILGTVTAEGEAAFMSGDIVLMDTDTASRIIFDDDYRSQKHFVSHIHLMFDPGADRDEVRRRVNEVIHGRALVRTPEEIDMSIQDVTASLQVGFTLIGYLALLVGLFLVYIALTVSVTERRQDIGILRSLGATRLQIAALFTGEALCLGIAGSLVGIPLGWSLASFSIGPVQKVMSDLFLPVEARTLTLRWSTILLAFGSGVATALLAALVPSMQAAQEEPADAVRRVPSRGHGLLRLLYIGSCLGLVLLGIGLLLAPKYVVPERMGSFGGIVILMMGTMAATPLITGLLCYLVQPLAHFVLGLHGRLAADNIGRTPGRTGLVIAVLAAGVALLVETAGLKTGTEVALLGWIDDKIPADLFVSEYGPITAAGTTLPMDESRATEITNDPELKGRIDSVVPFRIHAVDFRDRIVLLVAFDAQRAADVLQQRKAVPGSEQYRRLAREKNVVLVSKNFAAQYANTGTGNTIKLLGMKGEPLTFQVIGTIDDYTWNRGTIFMDRDIFKDYFGASQVDLLHVYTRPSPDSENQVRDILRRKGHLKEQYVLSRNEFREGLRDVLRDLYRISYAQLLVVSLVVSLGVVAALLISVLQRRRELGLLRAVGATRTQIVRCVLSEALLMGFFGCLIGLAVGIPLHWLALTVLLPVETGFVFPFVIPWGEVGIVIALALAIATGAGLIPALRAMRIHIAEAIAYE